MAKTSPISKTRTKSNKVKLTLHVDASLVKEVKIQAAREERGVGLLTQDAYRQYLKNKRLK